MNKITGKGFLIWQLESVMPVNRIIDALRQADCSWVCIKVANGLLKSNYTEELGYDPGLQDIVQQLKDAGFKVGGWHYIFTSNVAKPSPQAALLGERVQKLGLEFVMVDAEENKNVGSLWKSGSTRYSDAKAFTKAMRGAGVPLAMFAGLCSYRYPYMHSQLPWSAFLNSDSINAVTQQLYWEGSHNPREQLIQSMEEYDDWEGKYETMVPIGSSYTEHGWSPTPEELTEFVEAVDEFNLDGCGFYSLDHAINHPDWLDAIANGNTPPPPEPPEEVPLEEWAIYIDEWARTMGYDGPRPIVDDYFWVQVDTGGGNLNVRKDKNGAVVDTLPNGARVKVFPPTYFVGGWTRGEIDNAGSNRWIALEFTITL